MKKARKLKLCNWLLLVLAPIVLASSIQLEVTGSSDPTFVFLHIIVAILFVSLAVWHIALNLKWGNWFSKISKMKRPVTKVLWWLFLLTAISAIIALTHWLQSFEHSPLGGLHGKIGMAMIAVAIGHTLKRITYYGRKA